MSEDNQRYPWLKKDCRDCIHYPDCDFVETNWHDFNLRFPRGCSEYQEKVSAERPA